MKALAAGALGYSEAWATVSPVLYTLGNAKHTTHTRDARRWARALLAWAGALPLAGAALAGGYHITRAVVAMRVVARSTWTQRTARQHLGLDAEALGARDFARKNDNTGCACGGPARSAVVCQLSITAVRGGRVGLGWMICQAGDTPIGQWEAPGGDACAARWHNRVCGKRNVAHASNPLQRYRHRRVGRDGNSAGVTASYTHDAQAWWFVGALLRRTTIATALTSCQCQSTAASLPRRCTPPPPPPPPSRLHTRSMRNEKWSSSRARAPDKSFKHPGTWRKQVIHLCRWHPSVPAHTRRGPADPVTSHHPQTQHVQLPTSATSSRSYFRPALCKTTSQIYRIGT